MEGCGFRDQLRHFREFNTEIIGISFDDVATNRRFSEENGFQYSILSDLDRGIALKYGACVNRAAPMPKRMSYLIDERQRILYCWTRIEPGLHPAQIINTLYANFYKSFEEQMAGKGEGDAR
ncbi:MAG: redoxin domain-containing protein [Acidobacteria bacterium]|nr:redoxin domain-containing protein [Acidobacteriota bacterium]